MAARSQDQLARTQDQVARTQDQVAADSQDQAARRKSAEPGKDSVAHSQGRAVHRAEEAARTPAFVEHILAGQAVGTPAREPRTDS